MKTTAPKLAQRKLAADNFLQKIRAFVEEHLLDEIRVTDLARALFSTRIQIFRKIKSLTGQSPSQFVRSIRLEKAVELLRSTRLSIAEVAYSVGFADPKYFSRVFAASFGTAPSLFLQKK